MPSCATPTTRCALAPSIRRALLLMTCALAACPDDSPTPPDVVATTGAGPQIDCTPGEAVGCMCSDGRVGSQICADNGSELSRCECDDPPADSSGTGPDPSDSSGSDDTGGARCGNGVVDEGEQCDDGNRRPDDACSNECIEACGLQWEVDVGRPDESSFGQDAAFAPDGAVAVIGTVPTKAGADIWLASFEADGTERFSTTRSPSDVNDGVAVAVDADGRILAVSTVDAGGQTDIEVALFDAEGSMVWSDTLDGTDSGDDVATGAAFDGDGNAIVAGTTRVAEGDTDLWVARFAPDGTPQWQSSFSGVGNGTFSLDQGGHVVADTDGNVYAQAEVYVDFDERDVHLVKFDAAGGPAQWDFAPFAGGTAAEHRASGVGVDANGDVVMGMFNDAGAVSWAFWLSKVDADGNEIWRVDHDALGFEIGTTLDGLGVSDDGRIGLALTVAPEGENLRVAMASLLSDGTLGCQASVARRDGVLLSIGGASNAGADVVATGLVSEDQVTQQRWVARFRGAALGGR